MGMPVIVDVVENVNASDVVKSALVSLVGNKGKLRSTAPKDNGLAVYIWRVVTFAVSAYPQHATKPKHIDLYIPEEYYAEYIAKHDFQKLQMFLDKEVHPVIDDVINSIPDEDKADVAIRRWHRWNG